MPDRTAIRLTKQVCNVVRTVDCERNNGMPDLIHSTKHSWHSLGLHTFAQTLAHSCIGEGGGTVQFCSPFWKYFRVSNAVQKIGAKRLVIDSLRTVSGHGPRHPPE